MNWLKGEEIHMVTPLTANSIYSPDLRDRLKSRVINGVPIQVYRVVETIVPLTAGVNQLIIRPFSQWCDL